MRLSPIKSLFSCLLLIVLLYLLLLVWVIQEFSEGLVGMFSKEVLQKNMIEPFYAVGVIITSVWFWHSFARTRQGRDSEARVLGFLGITLLLPHVVITLWSLYDLTQELFL